MVTVKLHFNGYDCGETHASSDFTFCLDDFELSSESECDPEYCYAVLAFDFLSNNNYTDTQRRAFYNKLLDGALVSEALGYAVMGQIVSNVLEGVLNE
ncbi:MAG: hypothetical protein Unbinned8472contig1000_36 [Prokaryotic dsDNA virus sp.]|nr:MAG: hypothetical protein Unbinned8472contig1000_36 [Prokaryotic dsDNA virus sp.]|tara:strand:- start:1154 stop:1447 length:294 start_codon:yes stop_codon:yes gene_type:complete